MDMTRPPARTEETSRVLDVVRAAEAGLTTAQVASRTGLRPSTARSRLDVLVAAGLLVKARASGGTPHRPAWRYRATAPDPAPTMYRLLLQAVLDHLAGTGDDRDAAIRLGERWGRAITARVPDRDRPWSALMTVLDALGFTPRPAPADTEVHLLTCPYLDLVRKHPDAMCGLHAGIVNGVLRAGGATLEPFGAPEACVIHLTSPAHPPAHAAP